jgi:pyruvate dehydrogenase E2 component (dihydrolipoamide acetyltransferase)
MATKVFMEALSPTMEEGRLVKWLKNEGDSVKSGDVLAEVETDKAIMELVARGDGVLRKRLIEEGATSPVSSLIGVIAGADEDIESLVASASSSAAAPPPAAAVPEKSPPAPSPDAPRAPAAAPSPAPAASPTAAATSTTSSAPSAPESRTKS